MDPVLTLLTLIGTGAVILGLRYSFFKCDNESLNYAIIDPVYYNTASEIEIPPRYESPPQYNEVYNGD